MINVSVVEPHAVPRVGLKSLIDAHPSVDVVEAVDDLSLVDCQALDVVVLSFCAICDLPPVSTVAELSSEHRVVLYSGKETPVSLLAYENTDVHALLHQSDPDERLFNSICAESVGEGNLRPRKAQPVSALSDRESLVLTLVGAGYTNDQIARRIGISKHTVDTYLRRIRSKLNLGNKAQLARAAIQFSEARLLSRS